MSWGIINNRRYSVLPLLLTSFLSYFQLCSQSVNSLKFRHYGLDEGLSQVTSHCIVQDQKGHIWIGTQDGLNRFDGYSFKIFQHDIDNKNSITSSYIEALKVDSKGQLWVGTTKGLNLFDHKTEQFKSWQHNEEDSQSLSHNLIWCLYEDRDGRLWVGTQDGLNLMTENGFKQFKFNPGDTSSLSDNRILSMEQDDKGHLWVGTAKGLNRIDLETYKSTRFYQRNDWTHSVSNNRIEKIFRDHNNKLWIGTPTGLDLFNPLTQTFSHYRHDPENPSSISDDHILSIYEDSNHQLWIGTANNGVNLFNEADKTFTRYQANSNDPYSLSNNTVWCVLEDWQKNLWMGVSSKGFNFYNKQTAKFQHYRHITSLPSSLQHNAVRGILLDHENKLWVGTFSGLTVYDLASGQVSQHRHQPEDPNSLNSNHVISIFQDSKKRIWLGTSNGLNGYNPKTKNFVNVTNPADVISLSAAREIFEDSRGRIWIGTEQEGMLWLDTASLALQRPTYENEDFEALSNSMARQIIEDAKGRLWIATELGLNMFDPQKHLFQNYRNDKENSASISNNNVLSIAKGKQGKLWVGTRGGLNLFDPETGAFKVWNEKNGLSNNVIYGILIDGQDNLWLSTNKGINKFNPRTEEVFIYDENDGVQSSEFNAEAFYKDQNGLMYFGGVNGLSVFHPDSLSESRTEPNVYLTDLLLFNQSVLINDSSVLRKTLEYTEEVTLTSKEDMFAIEFAAIEYQQPDKIRYAYKLEPYNTEWIYTDSKDRKAVYTRVPAGTYVFTVKASNSSYSWPEKSKSIIIKILPPWWLTWWAILSYVVVGLLITLLIIRFQWKRFELKQKLAHEQREAEQMKNMDLMKSRFFSNITHEFRTPLTLIIGPTEQILKQRTLNEDFIRKQIEIISRNSKKFLQLVNQLLDLSKLEGKQMAVEKYRGNLEEFVRLLIENFDQSAQQQDIRLSFEARISNKSRVFDRGHLDKIISNLLSNALKFTPQKGSIKVVLTEGKAEQEEGVTISVEDSGIGIEPEQIPFIFDRFYQVDGSSKRKHEGTGIGLALTKELIELQGGTIDVSSEMNEGTRFTVFLPTKVTEQVEIEQNHVVMDDFTFQQSEYLPAFGQEFSEEGISKNANKPIVLIVEDNVDLRSFISSMLSETYQVITAPNGSIGVSRALKHIPDLIISDVMMPEMDGIEVSRLLKQHQLTSHIPIILLTAKTKLESRLEGYKSGADAYLSKPFNAEELQIVIKKLIDIRLELSTRYLDNTQEPESRFNELDEQLINKLHHFMDQELSNEELAVDDLAKAVSMSQSQLYRKVKALTDFSISGFLRNYRLTKAHELLKKGEHNVSEVSNMTGFGNRRYFHKVFVEKYQYPPSSVLKKLGTTQN